MKHRNENNTRRLSPKLGFLGLLGFIGLFGIWTYQTEQSVFPFLFFGFWGFFGFFYEGKMSNTLMDERYIQNKQRAELKAYRIGASLSFAVLIVSTWDWLFSTNDTKLLFITVALSLIFAAMVFVSEYLLYRYDHDENGDV